jgi:hypothetical protein
MSDKAVKQSSMARNYTPETKEQSNARQAADWRPGEALPPRKQSAPKPHKEWRPMPNPVINLDTASRAMRNRPTEIPAWLYKLAGPNEAGGE